MFLIQAETGKLLAPWGQYSLSSFLLRGVDTPVSGNELLGVCVWQWRGFICTDVYKHQLKWLYLGSRRDDSVVKRTYCYGRGSEFSSQHPCGS